MKKFLVIVFLGSTLYNIHAQEDEHVLNRYIENIVEQLASNSEDEVDFDAILGDLTNLYNNPLNLNNASLEDLEILWILNDFQINSLLDYRRRMRQIVSIHELRYIFGFTDRTVDLISPFVSCDPVKMKPSKDVKNVFKYGKHNILLRAGYRNTTSNDYLGSPIQQYTRYTGSFSKNIKLGLLGEKDAGEVYGQNLKTGGYDFLSGFVQVSTQSVLKSVTLGDYRVRLGQGLLIWNGYTSGKSSEILSLQKRGQGISGNSSSDENNFQRGLAITLENKGFSISMWGSKKAIDGSIDTLDNELIMQSINLSGYHRTETESARKNNVDEICYGSSISYKAQHFSGGINWHHAEFSLPLTPSDEAYKAKNFSGDKIDGVSMDYKWLIQKAQVYGEIAYANNAIAGIAGLNLMPTTQFNASISYRYYQPEYYTPYANGLVETGSTSNEEGLFAGIKWRTDLNIVLTAYADIFSFPWLRYNCDAPSNGTDYLVQLNYSPTRQFDLLLRYKYKEKEENYTSDDIYTSDIIAFGKQSLRVHASYKLSSTIRLASRFEWANSGYADQEKLPGYLAYQDIVYTPGKSTSLYFRYAQFHVQDYDSRIYAYENDALYAYSLPAYSGEGQKSYIMLRQKIYTNITFWLRYAITNSFLEDTETKHEFRTQMILKF